MKERMRATFKRYDTTRMTKEKFKAWIDSAKPDQDPEDILNEFDRQYAQLDADDRLELPNKTKMFLQALPPVWDDSIGPKLCPDDGIFESDWARVRRVVHRQTAKSRYRGRPDKTLAEDDSEKPKQSPTDEAILQLTK